MSDQIDIIGIIIGVIGALMLIGLFIHGAFKSDAANREKREKQQTERIEACRNFEDNEQRLLCLTVLGDNK